MLTLSPPMIRLARGRIEEALHVRLDPRVIEGWSRDDGLLTYRQTDRFDGFAVTFPVGLTDELRDWLACLPCSMEMWTEDVVEGEMCGWIYFQFPHVVWRKTTTHTWVNGVEVFALDGTTRSASGYFPTRWWPSGLGPDGDLFWGGYVRTQLRPPWPSRTA